MSLLLTQEQLMIQETARHFAMKEVLPAANALDPQRAHIPDHLRHSMAELGFFGITIPEGYGGLGLGCLEY
jgi:alkylation response protein AidB-like acyl-CoA dehydrogenase